MLRQSLLSWIQRPAPGKGTNYESTLPAIIATDTGLVRKENQDRAVVVRFASKGRTLTVFALADGMGGMRDGAHCASLGLAAFLEFFVTNDDLDTEARLYNAALCANDAVFSYSRGTGGATLSAVAVGGGDGTFNSVNIGDSRIFAFAEEGVERLTVDDSLAEAVGGHGRELLQFVGMGEGMKPHVRRSPNPGGGFLITSDGVHFVHPEVFETILGGAPTIKAAADRLMALARWCGGPDNATLIIAIANDVEAVSLEEGTLQFWDAFSTLHVISNMLQRKLSTAERLTHEPTSLPLGDKSVEQREAASKTTAGAKKPRRKRKKEQQQEVQLSISVEGVREETETNADR